MKSLHEQKPRPILHRDLKSTNVLLTNDRQVAKVCDFGLAQLEITLQSQGTFATVGGGGSAAGTLGYKAPETYGGETRTASDVFSFGILAYHALSFIVPFSDKSNGEILEMVGARFKKHVPYVQRALKAGSTLAQLEKEWLKDYPLQGRRLDLTKIEGDCAASLSHLVELCWADKPTDRLPFEGICIAFQTVKEEYLKEKAAAPTAAFTITLTGMQEKLSELEAENKRLGNAVAVEKVEADATTDDGGDGSVAAGGGGGGGGAAAAAAVARNSELEAENKRLVDEVAALAERNAADKRQFEAEVAAVEAEKAAVEAEKALADDRIAAVEAERDAGRQQYEAKVAALEAEKAAVEAERDAGRQQYEAKLAEQTELQAQLAARESRTMR